MPTISSASVRFSVIFVLPCSGSFSLTFTAHSANKPFSIIAEITAVPAFSPFTVPPETSAISSSSEYQLTERDFALSGVIVHSSSSVSPTNISASVLFKVISVSSGSLSVSVSVSSFVSVSVSVSSSSSFHTAMKYRSSVTLIMSPE